MTEGYLQKELLHRLGDRKGREGNYHNRDYEMRGSFGLHTTSSSTYYETSPFGNFRGVAPGHPMNSML